jgi:hypothetical protein
MLHVRSQAVLPLRGALGPAGLLLRLCYWRAFSCGRPLFFGVASGPFALRTSKRALRDEEVSHAGAGAGIRVCGLRNVKSPAPPAGALGSWHGACGEQNINI